MPGGVADRCLYDWMPTNARNTIHIFDMVTVNGTNLYSTKARGDIPVAMLVSSGRLSMYPLAAGQHYVLLRGTTVMNPDLNLSNYLDPRSCRDRITVVRSFGRSHKSSCPLRLQLLKLSLIHI